jgi:hypothetical protein
MFILHELEILYQPVIIFNYLASLLPLGSALKITSYLDLLVKK